MIKNFNNIIISEEILNVFQKHRWKREAKSKFNYTYNYKGDIADYYLNVSHKEKKINFEYILDLQVPKNKIHDFFILVNVINERSVDGYFTFNLKDNIIKYHFSKHYLDNITYEILLDLIDSNLKLTYYLFHNFTLFVHNLAYSETSSQELVELMLLKTKGNA
ncbi:hypothetical protein N8310_02520 [Pseudomonadota bacterium]|nr:hypothetical protein [Pseudomonadota bacterium]